MSSPPFNHFPQRIPLNPSGSMARCSAKAAKAFASAAAVSAASFQIVFGRRPIKHHSIGNWHLYTFDHFWWMANKKNISRNDSFFNYPKLDYRWFLPFAALATKVKLCFMSRSQKILNSIAGWWWSSFLSSHPPVLVTKHSPPEFHPVLGCLFLPCLEAWIAGGDE